MSERHCRNSVTASYIDPNVYDVYNFERAKKIIGNVITSLAKDHWIFANPLPVPDAAVEPRRVICRAKKYYDIRIFHLLLVVSARDQLMLTLVTFGRSLTERTKVISHQRSLLW